MWLQLTAQFKFGVSHLALELQSKRKTHPSVSDIPCTDHPIEGQTIASISWKGYSSTSFTPWVTHRMNIHLGEMLHPRDPPQAYRTNPIQCKQFPR